MKHCFSYGLPESPVVLKETPYSVSTHLVIGPLGGGRFGCLGVQETDESVNGKATNEFLPICNF